MNSFDNYQQQQQQQPPPQQQMNFYNGNPQDGGHGAGYDDYQNNSGYNQDQQYQDFDGNSQQQQQQQQHMNGSQNGSNYQQNRPPRRNNNNNSSQGPNGNLEPEQFRKCFIGGLSYTTTSEVFKEYFSKFGELVDFVVMKDNQTGKPKGFGFVTFAHSSMVDELMKSRPHVIDGRTVEPKRATPREDSGRREVQSSVKKLFIGGLRENVSEQDLRDYFGNYGTIVEAVVMREKETNKSRGFGFVVSDFGVCFIRNKLIFNFLNFFFKIEFRRLRSSWQDYL